MRVLLSVISVLWSLIFPASCIGKVAGPLNLLLKDEVAKILIAFYGISSEMDVGFLSTGSFQYRNKYEYNGKAINHAEVLKML